MFDFCEIYNDEVESFYFLNNSPDYKSREFTSFFAAPDGRWWNFERCELCGGLFLKCDLQEVKIEGEVHMVCEDCLESRLGSSLIWCNVQRGFVLKEGEQR